MLLKEYGQAFLSLFAARLCFVCAKKIPQGYICNKCADTITYLWPPLCRYCSKPLPADQFSVCKSCSDKTYPFNMALCITAYQEPMVYLLHLFKYQHYDYLAELFVEMFITHLRRLGYTSLDYDYILAVPLHRNKLKNRGYNQAELMAKGLSKHFGIPYHNDIIMAVTDRPSQTKLSPDKRKANVCDAFRISGEVKDKKVLLVDDILTTNATACACSELLHQKGAKTITVMTLSKTL